MWQVIINCSGDAWKQCGAEFKAMTDNYQTELIGSQKRPDETRTMTYKMEDINEVETFIEACLKFPGFTAYFESL